jgi:hypothetical protein
MDYQAFFYFSTHTTNHYEVFCLVFYGCRVVLVGLYT